MIEEIHREIFRPDISIDMHTFQLDRFLSQMIQGRLNCRSTLDISRRPTSASNAFLSNQHSHSTSRTH